MFTKQKLDLRQFFSRLEEVASKLQLEHNEKNLEFISAKEFKDAGNNVSRKIKNKVTIINNRNANSILNIMLEYPVDPVKGDHCGIYRTAGKLKTHYYSKNMTKDLAKYAKSWQKCHLAKTIKHVKCPMTLTETLIMQLEICNLFKVEQFVIQFI